MYPYCVCESCSGSFLCLETCLGEVFDMGGLRATTITVIGPGLWQYIRLWLLKIQQRMEVASARQSHWFRTVPTLSWQTLPGKARFQKCQIESENRFFRLEPSKWQKLGGGGWGDLQFSKEQQQVRWECWGKGKGLKTMPATWHSGAGVTGSKWLQRGNFHSIGYSGSGGQHGGVLPDAKRTVTSEVLK